MVIILPQVRSSPGGKAAQTALGRQQDLQETQANCPVERDHRRMRDGVQWESRASSKSVRGELAALTNSISRLEDEKKKLEAELGQLKFDFRERENKYAAAVVRARSLAMRWPVTISGWSAFKARHSNWKSRIGTVWLNWMPPRPT